MENFSDMIVKLIKNINPITEFIKKHENQMVEQGLDVYVLIFKKY